jgi:TP901-1 family phage major tail protein
MAAQKGRSLIIKQGTASGGTTVAAVRTISMTVNNTMVDVTTKDSAGTRALLEDGGITSLSIQVEGVFTDAAVEETVRGYAFANSINAFGLVLPNSDTIDASWQITNYTRSGGFDDAEVYSFTLESSGTITYTVV